MIQSQRMLILICITVTENMVALGVRVRQRFSQSLHGASVLTLSIRLDPLPLREIVAFVSILISWAWNNQNNTYSMLAGTDIRLLTQKYDF